MAEITKDQARLFRSAYEIEQVRDRQDDPEVRTILAAATERLYAAVARMPGICTGNGGLNVHKS